MDPNCSCDTPCSECDSMIEYYVDEFNEEFYDDDLYDCCIQIGWPHGDYCPCKEQAEHDRKMRLPWKWLPHKIDQLVWKLKLKIGRINSYLFSKTVCEVCKQSSMTRSFKNCKCPKCGETNLPF